MADAGVLTAGGNFRPCTADPGAFDTPESAQLLLHNLLAAHGPALGALRTPDGAASLAEVGGTPGDPQCLDVLQPDPCGRAAQSC